MLGFAFFHGEQILRVLFLILVGGIVAHTVVSGLLVKCCKGRLGNRAYWLAPHPRGSMSFPEIAVTNLRGLMRNDSASSQFLSPAITSGLPLIKAR